MRRRSSTGGNPHKAGRPKATAPGRPNAPKAARPRKSPSPGEETEVARLRRELNEAREQQAATSEVLKAISSSAGELQPMFEALLENAIRLCGAKFGNLYLREGDAFRTIAMHNVPPEFTDVRRRQPLIHPDSSSVLGRLVQRNAVIHITDVTAEEGYRGAARDVVGIRRGAISGISRVASHAARSIG
jgi:two-component system NtrC family sensor kinase